MKQGQKVIWDDDGQEHEGVVTDVVQRGRYTVGTHLGNLYIVRFFDVDVEGGTYTRSFDDYSLEHDLREA
jgi:hypothetical protein